MSLNNQQHKISISFFNDKEIRAAWDYDDKRYLTDCLPQNDLRKPFYGYTNFKSVIIHNPNLKFSKVFPRGLK